MNLEVLCYLGLLRFSDRLESLINLLPDASQPEAKALWQKLKDVPGPELLQRWSKLRDDEHLMVRQDLYAKAHIRLDQVPPAVKVWCISWLADQHE